MHSSKTLSRPTRTLNQRNQMLNDAITISKLKEIAEGEFEQDISKAERILYKKYHNLIDCTKELADTLINNQTQN